MTARDADVQSIGADGPRRPGPGGSSCGKRRTDCAAPGPSTAAFRQWRAASHKAPQKPSRKMKFPLALSKGLRYIRPTLSERTALPSSSGLGRRPLTAKTPVRVRLGVPNNPNSIEVIELIGLIASALKNEGLTFCRLYLFVLQHSESLALLRARMSWPARS